jgi:hypothetical protein
MNAFCAAILLAAAAADEPWECRQTGRREFLLERGSSSKQTGVAVRNVLEGLANN